jgi:hypothetical protein
MSLKGDETRMITNGITYCLIVDFIVLPMMIGSNFIEYTVFNEVDSVEVFMNFLGIKWGRHTDFGPQWFPDTGKVIMMAMLIFSVQ